MIGPETGRAAPREGDPEVPSADDRPVTHSADEEPPAPSMYDVSNVPPAPED
jgi:hypothetical protein